MERYVELEKLIGGIPKIRDSNTYLIDCRGKNIPKGTAYEIGKAIAFRLKDMKQEYFLISGDARISTPMIAHDITEALVDQGITVIDAGYNNVTPMFEVERARLKCSGLNITASHQGHEYNGLKIAFEVDPDASVTKKALDGANTIDSHKDVIFAQELLRDDYIQHLCANTQVACGEDKILYDAMQGASAPFFEEVAKRKGIKYDTFRRDANGYFPLTDDGPDPSRKSNFDILEKRVNLDDYVLTCLVDGDGDRFGAAICKKLIKPPVLVALRAVVLGSDKYVAEYCLSSIIADYLKKEGTDMIPVKRGRPNHIKACIDNKSPGSEIGLHHYNKFGVDDGIENALEFIELANRMGKKGLLDKLKEIEGSIRKFTNEGRVATNQRALSVVDRFAAGYGSPLKDSSSKLVDGYIWEAADFAVYVRGSDNANEITVNINATDVQTLDRLKTEVVDRLETIEPGLGAKVMSKL